MARYYGICKYCDSEVMVDTSATCDNCLARLGYFDDDDDTWDLDRPEYREL